MDFSEIIHSKLSGYKALINAALNYLPRDIQEKVKKEVVIVTMNGRYGYCLPVLIDRRVIILSELICPHKSGIEQDGRYYRWLIHAVLHEVAHAILHDIPAQENSLEYDKQEKEAHFQAITWYNDSEFRKECKKQSSCRKLRRVELKVRKTVENILRFTDTSLKAFIRDPIPDFENSSVNKFHISKEESGNAH